MHEYMHISTIGLIYKAKEANKSWHQIYRMVDNQLNTETKTAEGPLVTINQLKLAWNASCVTLLLLRM